MNITINSVQTALIDTAQSTSSSLLSSQFSQIKTQQKVKEFIFFLINSKRFSKVFSKMFLNYIAVQKIQFHHSKLTGFSIRTILTKSKIIETMAFDTLTIELWRNRSKFKERKKFNQAQSQSIDNILFIFQVLLISIKIQPNFYFSFYYI